jgi:hypothetical protein
MVRHVLETAGRRGDEVGEGQVRVIGLVLRLLTTQGVVGTSHADTHIHHTQPTTDRQSRGRNEWSGCTTTVLARVDQRLCSQPLVFPPSPPPHTHIYTSSSTQPLGAPPAVVGSRTWPSLHCGSHHCTQQRHPWHPSSRGRCQRLPCTAGGGGGGYRRKRHTNTPSSCGDVGQANATG